MKLLFVCTGNTCRSPMAMCLARARGHDARSAGLSVPFFGIPASSGALNALKARGLTLDDHHSRAVSLTDVQWAKKIICLTPAHRDMLCERYPEYSAKITSFLIPIPDPYLQGDDVYEAACALIESQLGDLIGEA